MISHFFDFIYHEGRWYFKGEGHRKDTGVNDKSDGMQLEDFPWDNAGSEIFTLYQQFFLNRKWVKERLKEPFTKEMVGK